MKYRSVATEPRKHYRRYAPPLEPPVAEQHLNFIGFAYESFNNRENCSAGSKEVRSKYEEYKEKCLEDEFKVRKFLEILEIYIPTKMKILFILLRFPVYLHERAVPQSLALIKSITPLNSENFLTCPRSQLTSSSRSNNKPDLTVFHLCYELWSNNIYPRKEKNEGKKKKRSMRLILRGIIHKWFRFRFYLRYEQLLQFAVWEWRCFGLQKGLLTLSRR